MKHHSHLCQFEVKLLAIPAAGWRWRGKQARRSTDTRGENFTDTVHTIFINKSYIITNTNYRYNTNLNFIINILKAFAV